MDSVKYSFWIKISVSFFLCLGMHTAESTKSYNKDWAVANIIGPLSENSSFKYYLEQQVRLIDTPYVFNQFLFLGGLGYQFNAKVMLFIGPGWILTKTPENNNHTEQRLWQQLNWQVLNDSILSLNSRSRLEERQRSDQSQTAFRLRERLWLRVPFKKWQSYSFSCFNELFFNINHPRWTSPYFFEQNRAFIGISKRLSKTAVLDVGYLNQFFHSTNNQADNVLLLSLTMIR
jgi:hypothetical protein